MARAKTRKSKGVRYKGKTLYGAAAKNIAKKRAAAKRKRTVAGKRKSASSVKRKAAPKRRRSAARKNPRKAAPKRSTSARKRSAAARKAARTRAANAAKRSAAARKAARTRKRTTRKNPKRKRSTTVARRKTTRRRVRRNPSRPTRKLSAATKRRRRQHRAWRKRQPAILPRRKAKRRRSTVSPGLRRGRRAIRRSVAYRRPADVAFRRKFGMRSNPKNAIIDAIKKAAPIAASLYGARAISRGLFPRIPGIDRLGRHAAPVASVGLLALAAFATRKGKLAKHRSTILLGMGLNVIDVVMKAYVPANVKAYIGMGATPLYDGPMGEYVAVGDVPPLSEPMGEYVEMGDYIEMGASEELGLGLEQELGLESEMGMGGAPLQIGTGIGNPWPSMEKPVPARAFSAPVPQRSFVKPVPQVGPGYDNLSTLYTGNFAGGAFGPKAC